MIVTNGLFRNILRKNNVAFAANSPCRPSLPSSENFKVHILREGIVKKSFNLLDCVVRVFHYLIFCCLAIQCCCKPHHKMTCRYII